jgi:hypothetical protein
MNIIIWIVLGIIGGYIFTKLQSKVIEKWKAKIKQEVPLVEDIENKIESFNWKKLWTGIVSLKNPTLWAKEFSWLFNLRKLVIVGVIIGVIYGVGYFKGVSGKPVFFNMQGKTALIKLNEHYLRIDKDGSAHVLDKDMKTILKDIKVKDIPGLRESLRPFGFECKPIGVIGVGVGESGKSFEGGLGLSFFKYWQWRLETFLTNKGGYLGTSYKLDKLKLDNSSIGLGIGKGFKGDNRVIVYYRWAF